MLKLKPTREEILKIKTYEDEGYKACMSNAENILKGKVPEN